jgi:hypothetical protein
MEAASVGEKDDCHGVAENGQMAPMGTGSFEVALDIDMLKDTITVFLCRVCWLPKSMGARHPVR